MEGLTPAESWNRNARPPEELRSRRRERYQQMTIASGANSAAQLPLGDGSLSSPEKATEEGRIDDKMVGLASPRAQHRHLTIAEEQDDVRAWATTTTAQQAEQQNSPSPSPNRPGSAPKRHTRTAEAAAAKSSVAGTNRRRRRPASASALTTSKHTGAFPYNP